MNNHHEIAMDWIRAQHAAVINHALRTAIRAAISRAAALGRVDLSIQFAADQLLMMAEIHPDLTPDKALQYCGLLSRRRWSNIIDWDEVLWKMADLWCELYRGLHSGQHSEPIAWPASRVQRPQMPQVKVERPGRRWLRIVLAIIMAVPLRLRRHRQQKATPPPQGTRRRRSPIDLTGQPSMESKR